MTKEILTTLGTVFCAALLAVPAVAASEKPATDTQKAAAKGAETVSVAWPAESLAGTIVAVDPAKRLVILKDAGGVPFDMVVSRSTRILSGNRELKLNDLTADANQKASVRFIPERRGDIAQSIRIGS